MKQISAFSFRFPHEVSQKSGDFSTLRDKFVGLHKYPGNINRIVYRIEKAAPKGAAERLLNRVCANLIANYIQIFVDVQNNIGSIKCSLYRLSCSLLYRRLAEYITE